MLRTFSGPICSKSIPSHRAAQTGLAPTDGGGEGASRRTPPLHTYPVASGPARNWRQLLQLRSRASPGVLPALLPQPKCLRRNQQGQLPWSSSPCCCKGLSSLLACQDHSSRTTVASSSRESNLYEQHQASKLKGI